MYVYSSNERSRTPKLVNHHLLDGIRLDDSGFPIVQPQEPPAGIADLLAFNEVLTTDSGAGMAVHFFIDDYQFERVWAKPELYIEQLRRFPAVCGPDFSLYTDYPSPLQRWNHYRNQLLMAYWQHEGLCVIPTASWADSDSYDWCFAGLPEHSILAISSVGCMVHRDATEALVEGTTALIQRKRPTELWVYGKVPKPLEGLLAGHGIPYRQFVHGQECRIRKLPADFDRG